jgi:uncharacterized protein YjbJ (UPF0337 family)
MFTYKIIIAAVLFGCLSVAVMSCEQKGPVEKAGNKIDETVEKAGDKVKEAGEAIKEKTEEVKKEVKEATQ